MASSAEAHFASVTFSGAERSEEGYLAVAMDTDDFLTQYLIRDYASGALLTLPDEGCIITEKLSELLGLHVGDEIVIDAGTRVRVPIAAISEQYVQHYVYLSAAAYEAALRRGRRAGHRLPHGGGTAPARGSAT